ncbi:MAG: hypothetical protein II170_07965, partial [Bacteroidaceae bacterium]|nr:hypothetical protein [Bacteroidaceae bacterium]
VIFFPWNSAEALPYPVMDNIISCEFFHKGSANERKSEEKFFFSSFSRVPPTFDRKSKGANERKSEEKLSFSSLF